MIIQIKVNRYQEILLESGMINILNPLSILMGKEDDYGVDIFGIKPKYLQYNVALSSKLIPLNIYSHICKLGGMFGQIRQSKLHH